MASVVVTGAPLVCSMGAAPTPLTVLPRPTLVEGRPAATIMDHVPMVNIATFGTCKSMANPATVALTAAAGGTPTPAPCVPATAAPWLPGSPTTLIGGLPALTNTSKCMCIWGGVVTVVAPGTMRTMCP